MYQQQAEQLYRETTPYRGVALDNHCIRLAELTLELCRVHAVQSDEDLVRAVCWVHDIGLMVKLDGERAYPRRGLRFIRQMVDGWDLSPRRRRVVEEMMLFNHALRPVSGLTREAEMLRRAVQVEHSLGLLRHGLAAAALREIFNRWPRSGLAPILVDFARITVLEDGPRQLLSLFFPRRDPAGDDDPRPDEVVPAR